MGRYRDRIKFLKDTAKEIFEANKVHWGRSLKSVREERQIAWTLPSEGWVKLNMDGASHGNPGLATAGGALSDSDGNWMGGFCAEHWDMLDTIGRTLGSLLWAVHCLGEGFISGGA